MSVSAFKSTSKRGSFANPGVSSSERRLRSEEPSTRVPSRRCRSVSAAPRSSRDAPAAMPEFPNKRDNPLFRASSVSPTDSEESVAVSREGRGDGTDCRRGRSASRCHGQQSGHRIEFGRSLSRVNMGRHRRSMSRGHYGNSDTDARISTWDDGVSMSSLSEAEEKTIKAVFEQMKCYQSDHPSSDSGGGIYETVRSEVRRPMSEIRSDLENGSQNLRIFGGSIHNIQGMHKRDTSLVAISNGFDCRSELMRHETSELVADIRKEYTMKLHETRERAKKLQADLDVEERRSQEISSFLKEMLPEPRSSEMQSSRPRHKTSIERHKMSRRLAEEAMNYFDECVSISTFDTSDFSSPEDQMIDCNIQMVKEDNCEARGPASPFVSFASDPTTHQQLDDSTRSRTSQFTFSGQPRAAGARELVSKFRKEPDECDKHLNDRSRYNADDYESNISLESFLLEKILLKNRTEAGGLLLCNVRML